MPNRSIWWVDGAGQASFAGSTVPLPGPPQLLPGEVVFEMQYIPHFGSEWVSTEANNGDVKTRPLLPEDCERINDALRKMKADGLRALGFS